jgi:hypothetical protein
VGPSERFASNASVRNRLVSFIDFTVVILRLEGFDSGPHTNGAATRSAGRVPHGPM